MVKTKDKAVSTNQVLMDKELRKLSKLKYRQYQLLVFTVHLQWINKYQKLKICIMLKEILRWNIG